MRKSNGYVVQWKGFKWENFGDEDGHIRYFDTIEEAKAFEAERHFNRKVERRICWHNGGHTYTLVEELGERF